MFKLDTVYADPFPHMVVDGFADDELTGAVDRLLADTALQQRMVANAEMIRGRQGTHRAADLIEALAR